MNTPEGLKLMNVAGKSTGINKTHLTPCRRVGLSRKFRTTPTRLPGSSSASSPSPVTPLSSLGRQSKEKLTPKESVPVVKESERKKRGRVNIQARFEKEEIETKKSKKAVEEKYDASFKDEEEAVAEVKSTSEVPAEEEEPKLETSGKSKLKNNEDDCDADFKVISVESNTKNKNEETEVIPSTTKKKTPKKSKTNKSKSKKAAPETSIEVDKPGEHLTPVHTNEDFKKTSTPINEPLKENFVELDKLQKKSLLERTEPLKEIPVEQDKLQKTSLKRCLSTKKSKEDLNNREMLLCSPIRSSTSLLSSDFMKECAVEVELLETDERDSQEFVRSFIKSSKKPKKCVIYSSDEDDFKEDTPKKTETSIDLQKKVREIKDRIKKKEAILTELKHAQVYKKLHKVDELEKDIAMWKKCCEDGLTYLLPKVQDHMPMDMQMLTTKLNIPDCIMYDENSGCFK